MKTLIIILTALMAIRISGQDIMDLKEALDHSYAYEYDSNYVASLEAIKNYYDEESYLLNARMGWLYYLVNEYDKSLEYYQRAIKLMPYALEARIGYAYPLGALGNWNAVIENYNKILEIDPQHSLINYRLGLIYYNQGRYSEAFPYVERVANLYPLDYYSVVLLGWIQLKMGRMREARILFEKALQLRPGDESATGGYKETG